MRILTVIFSLLAGLTGFVIMGLVAFATIQATGHAAIDGQDFKPKTLQENASLVLSLVSVAGALMSPIVFWKSVLASRILGAIAILGFTTVWTESGGGFLFFWAIPGVLFGAGAYLATRHNSGNNSPSNDD